MSHKETMYEVTVKFGEIEAKGFSQNDFNAVMSAVGTALSKHTEEEFKRGYITSMPMIMTFESLERFDFFLKEMNEGREDDEAPWMTYTVIVHDC
ncbi:hypothetical protein D3C87_1085490 [compost metagenome]